MPVHLLTPSSFHIARSSPPPTPVNLPTSPLTLTPRLSFSYISFPIPHAPPWAPNAFIYYSNGIYSISTSFYCAPSSCISLWDSQTPVSEHYIVADNNGSSTIVPHQFCLSSNFSSFDQSGLQAYEPQPNSSFCSTNNATATAFS
ncbi:hypothetical protein SUGI_1497870 [Cryptomeria japonica]|uniref:Uncharacterized protein n=1 Tax=Cryptomeria japonica TaxID=3369 RepID=A0AAD3NUK3_CRYJA|nr:hypothetical protein SUGI_1497870 [Cryptomeria japonica]